LKRGVEVSFSFIFPDNEGKYKRKDAARIVIGRKGDDDYRTLQ
jgi:hypothetical protein